MIPYRTPFFLPLFFRKLTWRIPSVNKELYLTFDDGPVPGPTEFVLETLQGHNIKATFFCIGDNVRKHPHIFKSIVSSGHTVGNHTFNHLNGWKTPLQTYLQNISACDAEMKKLLPPGSGSTLFRPPYGKITRKQIRQLSHYKIVMWDVLSMDFNKALDPEEALKKTIRAVRDGSIIIFHDSFKAEKNMTYMLPRVIGHFMSLGYTFKPL